MKEIDIKQTIDMQKTFFSSGKTLDIDFRINALKKLKTCINNYENDITEAILKDLGKSHFESYMCEIGLVLSEISYMLKHIRSCAREKRVHTPLSQFHSRSFKKPSPYGTVLIMSPWNYPFLLTLDPLVDAIAAGNTAVIKPSAYSPHTSQIIYGIIEKCFDREFISVITGGREENTFLLNQRFDYIFFTGSQSVGKEVMRHAADNLIPFTLELGGKSPCIVEKSANLKLAAKRIVFGKFLNCGQTCVAPDYIYCDAAVKKKLLAEIKKQISLQFGAAPLQNINYGRIINDKHFKRICGLMEPSKIIHGGQTDEAALRIEPTVMDNISFSDNVMKEEIFGPLLPILTYDSPWRYISLLPTNTPPEKLLPNVDLAAAVSMTQSSTLPPANWDSGDLAKAAWALIMEKTDFPPSPTTKALLTRKHGSICLCAINRTRRFTKS